MAGVEESLLDWPWKRMRFCKAAVSARLKASLDHPLATRRFARLWMIKAIRRIRGAGVWFVDIPRTSSTSIKVELGRLYGWPYGKANVIESEYRQEAFFRDHITASQMVACLGHKTWDALSTFAIVRNPWERMYSAYNYRVRKGHVDRKISFHEYLSRLRDTPEEALFGHPQLGWGMLTQYDFLHDGNDELLVKHVVRYESRGDQLASLASQLGLSSLGKLELQAGVAPANDYQRHYNPQLRDFVAERFRRDIDTFGYSFSHPASPDRRIWRDTTLES